MVFDDEYRKKRDQLWDEFFQPMIDSVKEEIICYDVDGELGCFHRPDEYCSCECHIIKMGMKK